MKFSVIMCLLCISLLIACAPSANTTQNVEIRPSPLPASTPLTEVDLTVNGIRSGTAEAKIISLIGRPKQVKNGFYDDCTGGYHRDLIYDGFTIDVLSDEHRRNYSVTHFELTSPQWEIDPEVHIGDSVAKIREIYGRPNTETAERLGYVTKDNLGGVDFYFDDGKLVRVEMAETLC